MAQSNQSNLQPQRAAFGVMLTTPKYQAMISRTIRDPARARRFVASITTAVAVNPALQECTNPSILSGALLGESLNLSPSPQLGQYYLVPFKSKAKYDRNGNQLEPACTKAQFVLGYKGYIQLALRSGQYKSLNVTEVKEGEYLGRDSITGDPRFRFIEDDDEREQHETIGYMASFEYLNGFQKVLYWSKQKMMQHADTYSKAFSRVAYEKLMAGQIPQGELWKYSSFWYKDFDGMAKKTMLRQLISKWGVMSIEMTSAYVADNQVITADENGNLSPEFETPDQPPAPTEPHTERPQIEGPNGQDFSGELQPEASEVVDLDDL